MSFKGGGPRASYRPELVEGIVVSDGCPYSAVDKSQNGLPKDLDESCPPMS